MEENSIGDPASGNNNNKKKVMRSNSDSPAKRSSRIDSCFSFKEVSIDSGIKSLKHLDSKKFKDQIKKWAKAVVSYARQVSDRYGSSRR